ncbi:hypothetical protein P3T17_003949 [Paraburkholderia sp. GAS82]|jgi:hypothetical protein
MARIRSGSCRELEMTDRAPWISRVADAGAPGTRAGSTPLTVEPVLLVEDDPELLSGTTELFRSIGYEVRTASNEAQAAEILGVH